EQRLSIRLSRNPAQLRSTLFPYTTLFRSMNVYSKFFAGQMAFKDPEAARQSVELIDRLYQQFELAGDRAGQHHALLMALTMFDRSEEHTSELQSRFDLVCRLLLEKKKRTK